MSRPRADPERERDRERKQEQGVGGGSGGLEVVPGLVLRLGGCEVVFQEGLQVLKGGPLLCVLLPAL